MKLSKLLPPMMTWETPECVLPWGDIAVESCSSCCYGEGKDWCRGEGKGACGCRKFSNSESSKENFIISCRRCVSAIVKVTSDICECQKRFGNLLGPRVLYLYYNVEFTSASWLQRHIVNQYDACDTLMLASDATLASASYCELAFSF